jgi:hypothetical protein
MSKILVVGFQRSGTTLIRRLIQIHPDVKKMWHEKKLLGKDIRKIVFNEYINFKKDNFGEKVPYYTYSVKGGFSGNILEYCQAWNNLFKKDAKIICVVRHPLDVGVSTAIKLNWAKNVDTVLKMQLQNIPIFLMHLKKLGNAYIYNQESLITNPKKILNRIFEHCNLDLNKIQKLYNYDKEYGFCFGKQVIKKDGLYYYKKINFKYNKNKWKHQIDALKSYYTEFD